MTYTKYTLGSGAASRPWWRQRGNGESREALEQGNMKNRGNHVLKQNLGQFYPLWEVRAPWVGERQRGMKIWSQAQSCTGWAVLRRCWTSARASSAAVALFDPSPQIALLLTCSGFPNLWLLCSAISYPVQNSCAPPFFLITSTAHSTGSAKQLQRAGLWARAWSPSPQTARIGFVLTFWAQGNSSEQERKRHRRFLLQPVRLGKVSIENLEHKSRRHDLILLLVPLVLHKKLSKIFSTSFSSKKKNNNKPSTSHTSEEKEKTDWSENKKEKQGKTYN